MNISDINLSEKDKTISHSIFTIVLLNIRSYVVQTKEKFSLVS